MSKAELTAKICKILNSTSQNGEVVVETYLSWLHLDSLDSVEVSMAIEDEFGVYIEPGDLEGPKPRWRTVQDLAEHIMEAMA